MDTAWIESVDNYLDTLEAAVDRLENSLHAFNSTTIQGQFSDLSVPTEATAEAVRELETLLDQRTTLLQSAGGPQRPRSLRGRALRRARDRDRLSRTEKLARRIEIQRQNAVSQFVTQYQLAETESRLVRMLTQTGPDPGTYGRQRRFVAAICWTDPRRACNPCGFQNLRIVSIAMGDADDTDQGELCSVG